METSKSKETTIFLLGVLEGIKKSNETILELKSSIDTQYSQGYTDGQKTYASSQNALIDDILNRFKGELI